MGMNVCTSAGAQRNHMSHVIHAEDPGSIPTQVEGSIRKMKTTVFAMHFDL